MFSQALCRSFLPSFGGGMDLHLADQCNSNSNSYCNLGHSYYLPNIAFGTEQAKNYLCGSAQFTVDEMEIYARE